MTDNHDKGVAEQVRGTELPPIRTAERLRRWADWFDRHRDGEPSSDMRAAASRIDALEDLLHDIYAHLGFPLQDPSRGAEVSPEPHSIAMRARIAAALKEGT